MKVRNLLLASAAIALAACSNENDWAIDAPVALTVNANITEVSNTRVGTTSFDANDSIGISVKSNNGGLTTGINVKYMATKGTDGKITFKATSPIYFADGKTVTFSAYYPYNASVKDGARTIALNTTGQTATNAVQSKFDFLYGEGEGSVASTNGITMNFTHKMAKLTLTFVAGNGVKNDGSNFVTNLGSTYSITGLKHDGEFNTASGVASLKSTATDEEITPAVPSANSSATVPTTQPSSIIIYPQNPTSLKVTLTYNGVSYIANLGIPAQTENTAAGFLAGNNYAYTVTLNQSGLTVSKSTITDWTTNAQGGVNAEYEYPYDIYNNGTDDGSNSGLGYDEEEKLTFEIDD